MGIPPILPPTPSDKDPITEPAAERLRGFGLAVCRRTVAGDSAGVILDQSHSDGVDLVAMATHGRSGFSRWILGSVAERVLRHAGVPLLLVHAEAEATPVPQIQERTEEAPQTR
jgi:nucleotide-binding universal stress UspA family protein